MKGHKTILTPEQQRWFVDNFPDTKNQDCARHLGISLRTVVRLARAIALQKSREFMLMTQREATNEARVMNRGDGNMGAINLLKYGEKYRFRKGETGIQRLGKEKEAEGRASHRCESKGKVIKIIQDTKDKINALINKKL